MTTRTVSNQRAHGEAVLDRLAAETVPAVLKAPAKEFKDAQRDVDVLVESRVRRRSASSAASRRLRASSVALLAFSTSRCERRTTILNHRCRRG